MTTLREILSEWLWIGPLAWTAVPCAVSAWLGATTRRTSSWPIAAGALAATAAWTGGPLAGAAAVGLAVASVRTKRRDRLVDRLHRGTCLVPVAVAVMYAAHLWALGEPVNTAQAALCGGLMLASAAGLLLRPSPPDLDPQRAFTPAQRAEVINRDGNRCGYCGVPGDAPGVQLAVDHVLAHSRGGRTHVSNAKMACTPDNALKSDRSWNDFVKVFRQRHGFDPGDFERSRGLARLFGR